MLLRLPLAEFRAVVEAARTAPAEAPLALLAPIDGDTEVWAAGVTYKRSEEARTEESQTPDVYTRVYHAARPELFFKATARRVSGPGGRIAVRRDSTWDVPEPELAAVINAHGEIVGYVISNDVSSRSIGSIDGENPLYLPQAKMYAGSCGGPRYHARLGARRPLQTYDTYAHRPRRPQLLGGRYEYRRAETPLG